MTSATMARRALGAFAVAAACAVPLVADETPAAPPESAPTAAAAPAQPPAETPAPAPPIVDAAPLPDDLLIDVTVLPGRNVREDQLVHIRRARYIVFPDGSMHAAVGREDPVALRMGIGPWSRRTLGVLTRPALSRVLTREAMADLWLLTQQCGFANPDDATFSANPALLAPKPSETLTIVTIGVGGRQGTFLDRTPFDPKAPEPADPSPAGRLVRGLARAAWATDEPSGDALVAPVRYDLGPNPYDRFLPVRALRISTSITPEPAATPSAPAQVPPRRP
ncbi:MAG: hypothetical protein JNM94_01665 [Phycisphaerae bacterium]|nr:hypothetical protein [Phycisphaerae bacterium]